MHQPLPPQADELLLRDLIEPLWAGRWIVVLVGGICAVVSGGLALASVPAYEAVTVLRVIESKSVDQAELARPDNFRPLLQNKTIAESLVRDFTLVQEPRYLWQAAGGPVAADQFGEVAQVDRIGATNLMQVRVRRANPELAAKVANALADRAIALNRRINQQEVVDARDYIKIQLDEAGKRVADVQARFVDIQQRSQVESLKKDAEVAIDLRSKLLELQAEISKERAFLARSETDLAASQRLVTTRRSIDRDPLLTEAARERAPGTSLLGLGLSEEQVNEAHSALDKQAAESRAKLAGLEGQRKLLVDDKRLESGDPPDPGQALRGRRRGHAPEGRVRDGPEGVHRPRPALRGRAHQGRRARRADSGRRYGRAAVAGAAAAHRHERLAGRTGWRPGRLCRPARPVRPDPLARQPARGLTAPGASRAGW